MKNVFNLKYKSGTHGDACTSYTLDIMTEVTLEKFILSVISNKLELGCIRVHYLNTNMENFNCATIDEKYSSHFDIKYEHGHIIHITDKSLYNKYKDTVLTNNIHNYANGGWSRMNYWIRIE